MEHRIVSPTVHPTALPVEGSVYVPYLYGGNALYLVNGFAYDAPISAATGEPDGPDDASMLGPVSDGMFSGPNGYARDERTSADEFVNLSEAVLLLGAAIKANIPAHYLSRATVGRADRILAVWDDGAMSFETTLGAFLRDNDPANDVEPLAPDDLDSILALDLGDRLRLFPGMNVQRTA